MAELDDKLYKKITDLCDAGNSKAEDEEYEEAFQLYEKALELVPDPVEDWEASTWIFAGMGDCKFLSGQYKEAHHYFTRAMYCPGAIGNAYLHLRLGQAQYETGNLERAQDELARAYMGDGDEIFEGEDPKYLAFIKSKLKNS